MAIENLSFSAYRAREAFSYSTAKAILDSPNKWALGVTKKRTEALDFGSLAHDMILSPHELSAKYLFVENPKLDMRIQSNKDLVADAEARGLIVVAKNLADNVRECIEAHRGLFNQYLNDLQGSCEVSYFAQIDGVDCKCRADFLSNDENRIIDLKFVKDATPQGFSKACADYGYHIQNALYCDLIGASEFLFIAIEKEAPFMCGIYKLSPEAIDLGRDLYKKALDLYVNKRYYVNNRYVARDCIFGTCDEIQTITLPNYAFYKN